MNHAKSFAVRVFNFWPRRTREKTSGTQGIQTLARPSPLAPFPRSFLFRPRFSFRAAESLTLLTTKKKHTRTKIAPAMQAIERGPFMNSSVPPFIKFALDVSFMCILYAVGLKMEDPSLSISIDYFQSSPSRILNRSFSFHRNQRGQSNTGSTGRSVRKNQWQVEKPWSSATVR